MRRFFGRHVVLLSDALSPNECRTRKLTTKTCGQAPGIAYVLRRFHGGTPIGSARVHQSLRPCGDSDEASAHPPLFIFSFSACRWPRCRGRL
jgi:hypothetical protein